MKKHLLLLIVLFVFCNIFSSCTDSVTNNKSTLEIEQKPIIEEIEDVEGLRVVSVTNAEYYLYKMEPLWAYSSNDVPYGSTLGSGIPKKQDGTDLDVKFTDFILVPASYSNLGYFSQGKWALTIYVLDKDYNQILKDPIHEEFYLNSFSNKLSIDLDSQMFVDGTNCSIKIDNFRFELPANESFYGKSEKDGYKLTVSLYKVNDGTASSFSTVVNPTDIPVLSENKTNIEFVSKSGASDDPKVYGVIKDFSIANGIYNGSYVVLIKLYEHNGSDFIDAGGMTFSFVAINGFVSVIEGDGSKIIDLKAADYIPIKGDGSIIIDSGKNADITITASVGTKTITSSDSVKTTDTVSFNATVESNNVVVDITSGQWFVNGNLSNTGNTFSYKPEGMEGKTLTITYMILDDTYNTISANYYLTVNAATTSPT